MDHPPIQIEEDPALRPLSELLATVERPGDFFAAGLREVPMPKIAIKGGKQLSFPVPAKQAQEWIRQAEEAPYGRGEETILDPSVRKVWQIAPSLVAIGGKSWESTLNGIVCDCAAALGCQETPVRAEFYKLLIYGPGSFFLPHRDSEKAPGMFGTLVISFPSPHEGGDLVIQHQGRETVLSLHTEEPSELAYAAFYADCEHEVRPITKGYRICLIYNLIQESAKGSPASLDVPDLRSQTAEAARLLQTCFGKPPEARKLIVLLDHEYTPEGLNFRALKNRDAAVGKVLREAAGETGLALHLAIVHIEETGAAEIAYAPRSSRWGRWSDDEDEDEDGEDFEIVEAMDVTFALDEFRTISGEKAGFGSLPFDGPELIPAGALNGEPPDVQRVTEATGNEGATYERSYHRAVLVLWPQVRTGEILLEGGPACALPYLRELTDHWLGTNPVKAASRRNADKELLRLAKTILDRWVPASPYAAAPLAVHRQAFWETLHLLGEGALVQSAMSQFATWCFDGAEAVPLARACASLSPKDATEALGKVIAARFAKSPEGCAALLRAWLDVVPKSLRTWKASASAVGAVIVEQLGSIQLPAPPRAFYSRRWTYPPPEPEPHPVGPGLVVSLITALVDAGGESLVTSAAQALNKFPEIYVPISVLAPALQELAVDASARERPSYRILWEATAAALIKATGAAPRMPGDWSQAGRIRCSCDFCVQVNAFAAHPVQQVLRIKAKTEDRAHLHRAIDGAGLEMTHITERKGSPYVLVLTKERRDYQKSVRRFGEDLLAASRLIDIAPLEGDSPVAELRRNLSRAGRGPS